MDLMENLSMAGVAWSWIAAGLVLVALELVVPGFVIFFFGLGAVLTGLVLFVVPGLSSSLQILLFAVASLLLLVTCRRFMPKSFRGRSTQAEGDPDDDEVAGSIARVAAPGLSAGHEGKVEFRGTLWNARAEGSDDLAAGTEVVVVRRENLLLVVRRA
jgi:membrane protein implicated in regulation of membrane protease activity